MRALNPMKRLLGRQLDSFPDLEPEFRELHRRCSPHSMTSIERLYALFKATEYIVGNRIPGDIVECGVWKGGSSMMCALSLLRAEDPQRRIFLYDTYAGMPEPGTRDVRHDGNPARARWLRAQRRNHNTWAYSPLEEVRRNLLSTGYPEERLVFVPGRVEDTIPGEAPETISLLRLDTDWYESTRHELEHLYPRLSLGGVLVLDDYGHWRGAREAVDEYFTQTGEFPLLSRIDYTGRIAIRTAQAVGGE